MKALVLATVLAVSQYTWGPYTGRASRVIDGDTAVLHLQVWPNITVTIFARLFGIDAPEIRGGDCLEEKELGLQSKQYLTELLMGESLAVEVTGFDSFNRPLTRIIVNGDDVSDKMIQKEMAG